MILILIKITKGKAQKDQFLLLVNSSLTHELNEYNEYKDFYIEQCELLFSDDEALRQINLNPKTPKKIDNSIEHEELKNYYIYLLYRPKYFQKTDLDGMEKIKKSNEKRKSIKDNNKKYKKTTTSDGNISKDSESEDNEKGDRLDERDMISKNRTKEPSYSYSAKNKNKSDKKNSYKKIKKENEEDDPDYAKISSILNSRDKSAKKKRRKKKK